MRSQQRFGGYTLVGLHFTAAEIVASLDTACEDWDAGRIDHLHHLPPPEGPAAMSLRAEGRRFAQELRRNRRARLLAHQTIARMDGGWWGGILQNRVPTRFVQKYTRRARLEPSGAHDAVEEVRDTPVILAMAVLETPSSRTRRMSSSLPSRRETPSAPFGRPSCLPEARALGEALAGALGDAGRARPRRTARRAWS